MNEFKAIMLLVNTLLGNKFSDVDIAVLTALARTKWLAFALKLRINLAISKVSRTTTALELRRSLFPYYKTGSGRMS